MLLKTHPLAIAISTILVSALAINCAADHQDSAPATPIDSTRSPIDISPIATTDSKSTDPLRLRITNVSQRPFRYLGGIGVYGDPKVPGLMEIEVFESGKLVKPLLLPGQLGGDEKDVYEIAPGESVDIQVWLSAFYKTFPPGEYRVDLALQLKPESGLTSRYRLTPIQFQKQVVWLDVK